MFSYYFVIMLFVGTHQIRCSEPNFGVAAKYAFTLSLWTTNGFAFRLLQISTVTGDGVRITRNGPLNWHICFPWNFRGNRPTVEQNTSAAELYNHSTAYFLRRFISTLSYFGVRLCYSTSDHFPETIIRLFDWSFLSHSIDDIIRSSNFHLLKLEHSANNQCCHDDSLYRLP